MVSSRANALQLTFQLQHVPTPDALDEFQAAWWIALDLQPRAWVLRPHDVATFQPRVVDLVYMCRWDYMRKAVSCSWM
jgi:hypothetical protein